MNALSYSLTRDPSLTRAIDDVQQAREGLAQLLEAVRGEARQAEDPQVIGKIGDVHIRIEVAAALIERAEAFAAGARDDAEKTVAAAEAAIASAEALLHVDNTRWTLTGQRAQVPPRHDPLHDPLHLKYTLIGNFRLNGVVPTRSRSAVDVP